ncbi:MAG TPA: hypothetical protein VGM03_00510 [Phycisphaerae bacterium]
MTTGDGRDNLHPDGTQKVVAALAMMIRESGDSLFVARDYYTPGATSTDHWRFWPQRLGVAQGSYSISWVNGPWSSPHLIAQREFLCATLKVDLTYSLCEDTYDDAVTVGWGTGCFESPQP